MPVWDNAGCNCRAELEGAEAQRGAARTVWCRTAGSSFKTNWGEPMPADEKLDRISLIAFLSSFQRPDLDIESRQVVLAWDQKELTEEKYQEAVVKHDQWKESGRKFVPSIPGKAAGNTSCAKPFRGRNGAKDMRRKENKPLYKNPQTNVVQCFANGFQPAGFTVTHAAEMLTNGSWVTAVTSKNPDTEVGEGVAPNHQAESTPSTNPSASPHPPPHPSPLLRHHRDANSNPSPEAPKFLKAQRKGRKRKGRPEPVMDFEEERKKLAAAATVDVERIEINSTSEGSPARSADRSSSRETSPAQASGGAASTQRGIQRTEQELLAASAVLLSHAKSKPTPKAQSETVAETETASAVTFSTNKDLRGLQKDAQRQSQENALANNMGPANVKRASIPTNRFVDLPQQ